MLGNIEISVKNIIYQVGRRFNTRAGAFGSPSADSVMLANDKDMSAVVSDELVGLAGEYPNFAGHFQSSGLAGVVERIATGLAQWTFLSGVDTTPLRNGRPYYLSLRFKSRVLSIPLGFLSPMSEAL